MKKVIFVFAVLAGLSAFSQAIVDVRRSGAEKILVSVDVASSPSFKRSLERNLYLSGNFRLVARGASVVVSGSSSGTVVVEGRGKKISFPVQSSDDKTSRMQARRISDKMCEVYAQAKGFASKRIAFVNKKGRSEELCTGYPDGSDIRQITSDGTACVGPRWKSDGILFYTGWVNNAPQIFEIDADTCARKLKWGFGGLTTGATISPCGNYAAIILSKPFGNPELCVIDIAAGKWKRLTNSRLVNEGQPAWSPDGKKIIYVSDETRRLHLYIVDTATKQVRRLTSTGSQNVDPDWGPKGEIAYTTKRAGSAYVAVMSSAEGDKTARLVTAAGNWEHPTWACDGRHLIAECDGALYLIDTEDGGEKPVRLFTIPGKCITPAWSR